MTSPWVFCGARRLPVPRAETFVPPARLPHAGDVAGAVRRALSSPIGAPALHRLASRRTRVAVAIPDDSRPCPSDVLLRHVLQELLLAGVPDDRIRVVVGCGLHAATTAQQRRRLVGPTLPACIEVVDAQAATSETADLGRTESGVPVRIARAVADADVAVSLGVVEPHLYAGFSGGVKGVAIGCAGEETIAATHHPAFISRPGVAPGRLDGNPFRQALLEIAARTPLAWAANVVVNERHDVAAVAAGDPTRVQDELAQRHAGAWLHPVDRTFDVVVAGVPAPKSENLYQASRAATYLGLAERPALADGGLIVLCADLPHDAGEGPAERNFFAVLAASASPAGLVDGGLREPLGPGGQRSFVVARTLRRFRLAVVGAANPAFMAPLQRLGMAAFDSVDAAVSWAETRLDRRARVLAVADAMNTLVQARPSTGA